VRVVEPQIVVDASGTGADSPWRRWLEIEEVCSREDVRAESEAAEVCHAEAFPQEGDG
jgi:hypothetical protein